MVQVALQLSLVDEIRRLFDGVLLKDALGRDRPLKVISQLMPAEKGLNVLDLFPLIRVMLVDGDDPGVDDPSQCRVVFSVGIMSPDEQGHQDVGHILQRIQEHLIAGRVIDERYELCYPIKWRFKTEDRYPVFFGELETIWTVGKVNSGFDELT